MRELLAPSVSDVKVQSTRQALIAALAGAVLLLDQITKVWAVSALDDRTIDVVWKLQLRLVRNPGTAFSLGEGKGPLLGVVACGVVVVLVTLARQPRSVASAVGIALLLGGAVGNIVDRIVRSPHGFLEGHVVDFIDFQFWPVFNVADMGVTCGIILVIFESQEAGRREARAPSAIDD
ncbi:MAG TPA: signal peptidase II [Acidimicrobiales bacterium]|nr:signal peptidase II [Acidimicrobiales bacterium]